MNIFFIDKDPARAAKYMFKEHLIKMPLESAQLLCTAVRLLTTDADVLRCMENPVFCKNTHPNHPSALWVRQSKENFQWLVTHAVHIDYYRLLYSGRQEHHRNLPNILYCSTLADTLPFPSSGLTDIFLAMPDSIKEQYAYKRPDGIWAADWENGVQAYRDYYNEKTFKPNSIATREAGIRYPSFYPTQEKPWWYIR